MHDQELSKLCMLQPGYQRGWSCLLDTSFRVLSRQPTGSGGAWGPCFGGRGGGIPVMQVRMADLPPIPCLLHQHPLPICSPSTHLDLSSCKCILSWNPLPSGFTPFSQTSHFCVAFFGCPGTRSIEQDTQRSACLRLKGVHHHNLESGRLFYPDALGSS